MELAEAARNARQAMRILGLGFILPMSFDSFLDAAASFNVTEMSGLVGYESSGGEDEDGKFTPVKAAVRCSYPPTIQYVRTTL